jgi:hypothetical protein
MNKKTQKQLMMTVAIWDLFDESLSLIDERTLRQGMKYRFKSLSIQSKLMRTELKLAGVLDQEEDDYERVKEEIAEIVFNQFNLIE